jgi:exodeoxyribonuclease V alpha subunit
VLVIEGAAGAGKTTTLAATARLLAGQGHRLCVVTPTLKAAQVAGRELGASATSAAWLVHQYGFRWEEDGRRTRVSTLPVPEAELARGDLLLIDEAGMLDQDTARALLTIADESGARVALVGDRHQLPAVGRGGVLDLAVRWAGPGALTSLDVVHRFSDAEYAAISPRSARPQRAAGDRRCRWWS